jgi:hypothetical protein
MVIIVRKNGTSIEVDEDVADRSTYLKFPSCV